MPFSHPIQRIRHRTFHIVIMATLDSVPIAAAAKTLYGAVDDAEKGSPLGETKPTVQRLGRIGLAMIIFFNVSGGPFVSEDAVGAAGPLYAILAFVLASILYAAPSALISAELSTTIPEDAGVAAWVSAAFGARWGFTEGVLFSLNSAISNASYPLMLMDYVRYAVCPEPAEHFFAEARHAYCEPLDARLLSFFPSNGVLVMVAFVLFISWLNWRGLKFVGPTTIACVIFVLLPIAVLCFMGLPNLHPTEWLRTEPFARSTKVGSDHVNWLALLNAVFWCLNFWDSAGSFAGEVDQPEKDLPSALGWCLLISVLNYLLPIMVCTAALPGQTWATGFWVQAGFELGGPFLQWWVCAAALMSISGQLLAGQATFSYEIAGMAEIGQLPAVCATRNSNGVPIGPLVTSIIVLVSVCACSSLSSAIAVANGVYALAELIEYAAFLWLRWKHPLLHRPFRIPVGIVGCTLLLVIPALVSGILFTSPFWTSGAGHWWIAGFMVCVALLGPLLHTCLSCLRRSVPDAFFDEKFCQSQGLVHMQEKH